jgi:hypothetical protein
MKSLLAPLLRIQRDQFTVSGQNRLRVRRGRTRDGVGLTIEICDRGQPSGANLLAVVLDGFDPTDSCACADPNAILHLLPRVETIWQSIPEGYPIPGVKNAPLW